MGLTKTATGVSFPWSIIIFLKVLGILKGFFQKALERGSGAEPLVLRSPINCNLANYFSVLTASAQYQFPSIWVRVTLHPGWYLPASTAVLPASLVQ